MMSPDKLIVFVTGGNTGLGYETIKALYKTDQAYELIIGSRKVTNGQNAAESLQKEIPKSSSSISVVQLDLASDESIFNAVKEIESKFGHLDVLINNGGAGFDHQIHDKSMTIREAWNTSWDINVAGTQVLTDAAIPLLLKSSDPRLMFLTSGTASLTEAESTATPTLARINGSPAAGWPKGAQGARFASYRSVKTGLNMMMREWHRVLLNDGVKVWSISPGFLATGLNNVGADQLRKVRRRQSLWYYHNGC
jgi:NAD(P)-dependent dehydrogenase (short-subunit alcohol dehydrogenase family)